MSVKGTTYNTSNSELVSNPKTVSNSETLVGEERRKNGGWSTGRKEPRSRPGMRVSINKILIKDFTTGVDPVYDAMIWITLHALAELGRKSQTNHKPSEEFLRLKKPS